MDQTIETRRQKEAQYLEAALAYIDEIKSYDPKLERASKMEICSIFQRFLVEKSTTVHHLVDASDGYDKYMGFFIIGTKPNCREDCDYYIMESYIKPEYRGNGVMTSAISEFVRENPGRYCMFLLKADRKVRRFWETLFRLLNLKMSEIDDEYSNGLTIQYIIEKA